MTNKINLWGVFDANDQLVKVMALPIEIATPTSDKIHLLNQSVLSEAYNNTVARTGEPSNPFMYEDYHRTYDPRRLSHTEICPSTGIIRHRYELHDFGHSEWLWGFPSFLPFQMNLGKIFKQPLKAVG